MIKWKMLNTKTKIWNRILSVTPILLLLFSKHYPCGERRRAASAVVALRAHHRRAAPPTLLSSCLQSTATQYVLGKWQLLLPAESGKKCVLTLYYLVNY